MKMVTALDIRSAEGESNRIAALRTSGYRLKQSLASRKALANPKIRQKVSENTKLGCARRKERLKNGWRTNLIIGTNLGDICYGHQLGLATNQLLIWAECPRCKKLRWAQKKYVSKMCGDCNRKDPIKRQKFSNSLKGYRAFRFHKGKKRGTRLGYKCSEEHKEKVRQTSLAQWRDPIKRERIIRSLLELRAPNNQELEVLDLLNINFGNEWKFVGDGQMIIGGLCPDFININGKKLIIEYFGRRWHRPQEEKFKTKVYSQFGYRTLVIWSEELTDKVKLITKVDGFLKGN